MTDPNGTEVRGFNQVTVIYPDGTRIDHDEYQFSDPNANALAVATLLEGLPVGTRAECNLRIETRVNGVLVMVIQDTEAFTYQGHRGDGNEKPA